MKKFFIRFRNWVFGKHPYKKTLQNCPCYDADGNFIGWFSRSVAVSLFVFAYNKDEELCVLASQRGEGTPDPEYIGAWNASCGYLDFNETLKDAAIRELKEETGVNIEVDKDRIYLLKVNDKPEGDKRQNICFHHYVLLTAHSEWYETQFSHENNEKDEVGDIRFIPISKINNYKWAFGHDNLIAECLKCIC